MVSDIRYPAARHERRSRWRMALGIGLSSGVVALTYINRQWLGEAWALAGTARPFWLLAALAIILGSYFVSSQVFQAVLRSMGYHVNALRLWGIALVAIVTSQSLPAGGVGSYAFLLREFRREGISGRQAALVATLEAFSYAGAMVLFATFGVAYVFWRALALDSGAALMAGPLLAGLVALLLIGAAAILLTRPAATLARWLLAISAALARLRRRPLETEWASRVAGEISSTRELLAGRKRLLAGLVLIQLVALSGHSLALYLILHSLGAAPGAEAAVPAFGIALLTSTFNVLPGGGGTVETVLAVMLAQLAAGAAAVPAAILFRLLNFWVMLPLAGACYYWLGHARRGIL